MRRVLFDAQVCVPAFQPKLNVVRRGYTLGSDLPETVTKARCLQVAFPWGKRARSSSAQLMSECAHITASLAVLCAVPFVLSGLLSPCLPQSPTSAGDIADHQRHHRCSNVSSPYVQER